MLVCAFLVMHIAHETAGAARTRSSLRPLASEGTDEIANLGHSVCCENEDAHPVVIARLDRATQYSRAPMMNTRGCGILDHPAFAGDDSFRWSDEKSPRHCERSEAIQGPKEELDCFVARAPRNDDMIRLFEI
jgi:hypothetical protein